MRKFVVFMLCMVMVLSLCACEVGNSRMQQELDDGDNVSDVGVPNPYAEYDTVKEAESALDFPVKEITVTGYILSDIRVMSSKMLELIYLKGEDEVRYRMQKTEGDISGDYNKYTEIMSETIGEYEVTFKGNDGSIKVAIWQSGEYSFSITANNDGVDSDIMKGYVQSCK